MYGESDVRVSHLDTGRVEARSEMDAKWFGEGLARVGGSLYQITWRGPHGFIYSTRDLKLTGTFQTPLRDGWGAAADGALLVLSDGGSKLTWVDPADGFKAVRSVEVTAEGRPVHMLNEVCLKKGGRCGTGCGSGAGADWGLQRGPSTRELTHQHAKTPPTNTNTINNTTPTNGQQLEVVDGEVWANVWQTECVARVDPASGNVTGWVLMHGLRQALHERGLPMKGKSMDVLNGIAYDEGRRRLFVTGKYWPRVFEVTVAAVDPNAADSRRRAESCFVGAGHGLL